MSDDGDKIEIIDQDYGNYLKALTNEVQTEEPFVPTREDNILTAFWNAPWRNWAIFGGIAALVITLVVTHLPSPAATPAAKVQQMNQQLAKTAVALENAGYKTSIVAPAEHRVALEYGTDIILSAPNVASASKSSKYYVTSSLTPEHYVSLDHVNTNAYLSSLSKTPRTDDLMRNTSVVHDAQIDTEK